MPQSNTLCAGQVEHNRLNIPRATPVAVQQWEGLIAINYAARAAGITRHMRVGEATKICPDLQAVHVQTLGAGPDTTRHDSLAYVSSHQGAQLCVIDLLSKYTFRCF